MSTLKVTDDSFQADVLGAEMPVVVDFWAEWCGPCKMIGPSLEEIAKELDGKVRIAKVNVDENPRIAGKLGIRSIPPLMPAAKQTAALRCGMPSNASQHGSFSGAAAS